MPRIWTIAACIVGCLAATQAMAGPYYLEAPARPKRAEAVEMSRSVDLDGPKARVVRRYSQGQGWQYLLRVEGFDEEAPAREAAVALARQLDAPITVLDADGGTVREVGRVEPVAVQQRAAPDDEPARARRNGSVDVDDAEAVLAEASEAHGGPKGGLAAIQASSAVTFRFTRRLPTGLVAEHTWARSDAGTFLEVRVIEGEGRSSRLLIRGDRAWLAVDQGDLEPTDLARAVETQARFEPDQVVPFVLAFASALETRRELELLQTDGTIDVGGREAVVLRYAGDRATGPMSIHVDRERGFVLEVVFEGDDLRYRFDGWQRRGGLVLPERVRTWRAGALTDTVDIAELDIRTRPSEAWFVAP